MNNAIAFGQLNYAILGIYITAMISVGVYFSRKQTSISDYFLAGRKLPWMAVAMSMYASVTSAMTFMGLPGLAYSQNVTLLVVCLMSPVIAPVLIFLIYPLYRKLNLTTSYEYISFRFGRNARVATAVLFILARLGWLGTVIYAPALALHVTTGIPQHLAICIIGLLATIYCVMGGLSAVIWTDVPQFIIMISGAVIMIIVLCGLIPDGAMGILHEGHLADKINLFDWSIQPGQMTALAVALAYVFILLQDYGVDQVTVQRLLAVKTDRGVTKAILFNAVTDFLIIGMLLFIGLGLFVYYQHHPALLPSDLSPDRILPWFILHELPKGISGLIIAAIFAAAMSSVDSGLNSLTTVILHDVAAPLSGHEDMKKHGVLIARIITFTLGALATLVAMYVFEYIGGIIKSFYTFMGLFSAPVLALFLLGMVTKRANFNGWIIASVISVASIVLIDKNTQLHEIYFFPVSAMITIVLGYLLSLPLPSAAANPDYRWVKVMSR